MPTDMVDSEVRELSEVIGLRRFTSDHPSHITTASTAATPKKTSQRVASAFIAWAFGLF